MRHSLSPLLTDLYQLTMMQAYHDQTMEEEAVFELFFRKLPPERDFLVACGLEQVLEYLENLRFSEEDIAFLEKDGRFQPSFLESLRDFRFTGSVHSLPEGTVFFADEPLIRITAPLPQAQLVETRIINILQFQTMIASKAARMKRVMPDKILVDYGLRRAHGAEAGVMAARASYLAGFNGTATVLAGRLFDIPIYGTMAHSFIQAHDSEREAFLHFAESHPTNTILLLDTYDTEEGAHRVVAMAEEFNKRGVQVRGVRLDSGDMVALARKVRKILDAGGMTDTMIFASGNLDEYALETFRREEAPVDGFGIGTKLTTSADVPYFDCTYKLVEYRGLGRRKLSKNKATWPGRKQIFRSSTPNGTMAGDVLGLEHEQLAGEPRIIKVMEQGRRTGPSPSLAQSRDLAISEYQKLPPLPGDGGPTYPVTVSAGLQTMADEVTERMLARNR